MKVLFAGTPDFAVAPLKALAEQHEIVGVFTQPDRRAGRGKKLTPPPVKVLAEALGIPVYQPSSLKNQAEIIRGLNADVMVVVAYGMLLPQSILDIPRLGCINIHASLLPRWRGAAPIQRAIEAGDQETGVSIMRMELGLDTGPVFQMLKTDITDTDTSASLHDKLASLGSQGICETLATLSENPMIQPTKQDDGLSTYAKKISKQEAVIDWSQSAEQIARKLRAFIPWPGCQTQHGDTRLRLWQASVVTNEHNETAGVILDVNEQGATVACGADSLRLEVLQRDGSKALTYKEFANGYPLHPGDQLG